MTGSRRKILKLIFKTVWKRRLKWILNDFFVAVRNNNGRRDKPGLAADGQIKELRVCAGWRWRSALQLLRKVNEEKGKGAAKEPNMRRCELEREVNPRWVVGERCCGGCVPCSMFCEKRPHSWQSLAHEGLLAVWMGWSGHSHALSHPSTPTYQPRSWPVAIYVYLSVGRWEWRSKLAVEQAHMAWGLHSYLWSH